MIGIDTTLMSALLTALFIFGVLSSLLFYKRTLKGKSNASIAAYLIIGGFSFVVLPLLLLLVLIYIMAEFLSFQ